LGTSPVARREYDRQVSRAGKKHIVSGVGIASAEAFGSITIHVQTRLMLHWARIAIDHERRAAEARAILVTEAQEAKSTGAGIELDREMHPAIVAIAGAAHALEALYREITGLVQPESVRAWERAARRGRWSQVRAALEIGFEVEQGRWGSQLRRLFKLRNGLVHPETAFSETVPHPLGVNTAPEYVDYSPETATWAVDFLLEILAACCATPREPLEEWAAGAREPVQQLVERRAGGTS
jgi:hypothetical protein